MSWLDEMREKIGPMRTDVLDYPTGWQIQRAVGSELEHDPHCASVYGSSPLSGPMWLCDCRAVEALWDLLVKEAP